MKYLVMECHPGYAVLLDERGRFLKAANRNYQVGQTVRDPVVMEFPARRVSPWRRLAPIAACLVLVLGLAFALERMPCASVYLTINPQVRVDVNRFDRVVAVQGVNPDGTDLLLNYDHQRKDLDTVMDDLVELAIQKGYLHPGGKVTLTLNAGERWVSGHREDLNRNMTRHLSGGLTVEVHTGTTPPQESDPVTTIPVTPRPTGEPESGYTDYGNSDYGPGGDGVTDYADTDYGPGSDGVTDYADTDYGSGSDGVTDYDSDSGYDPPDSHNSDYDRDGPDSHYASSDYDD